MKSTYLNLLIITIFLSFPACAQSSDAKIDNILIEASKPSPNGDDRVISSEAAIKALIKDGYVSKKPDLRSDYTDYRVFHKPIKFFDQDLVMIEEEYLVKYVGCCVNPGIGFIVKLESEPVALKKFANENKCSVDESPLDEFIAKLLGSKFAQNKYLSMSCRERDLNN